MLIKYILMQQRPKYEDFLRHTLEVQGANPLHLSTPTNKARPPMPYYPKQGRDTADTSKSMVEPSSKTEYEKPILRETQVVSRFNSARKKEHPNTNRESVEHLSPYKSDISPNKISRRQLEVSKRQEGLSQNLLNPQQGQMPLRQSGHNSSMSDLRKLCAREEGERDKRGYKATLDPSRSYAEFRDKASSSMQITVNMPPS
jgi:hypothetical protein